VNANHSATGVPIKSRLPTLILQAGRHERPQLKSNHLADAPKQGQWPLGDAGEALAPGVVAHAHAQRRIECVIEGDFVEPARRGFFLLETRGIEPGGDFRLDRRVCRGAAVSLGLATLPLANAAGRDGQLIWAVHVQNLRSDLTYSRASESDRHLALITMQKHVHIPSI
jgi:hypothetical protein